MLIEYLAVILYYCAGPLYNPSAVFAILELNEAPLSIFAAVKLRISLHSDTDIFQSKISASWDIKTRGRVSQLSSASYYLLCFPAAAFVHLDA